MNRKINKNTERLSKGVYKSKRSVVDPALFERLHRTKTNREELNTLGVGNQGNELKYSPSLLKVKSYKGLNKQVKKKEKTFKETIADLKKLESILTSRFDKGEDLSFFRNTIPNNFSSDSLYNESYGSSLISKEEILFLKKEIIEFKINYFLFGKHLLNVKYTKEYLKKLLKRIESYKEISKDVLKRTDVRKDQIIVLPDAEEIIKIVLNF